MKLIDLHAINPVQEEFNPSQLLPILLDDAIFPIPNEQLVIGKTEELMLRTSDTDFVYAIEQGVSALVLDKQIIDFVDENRFVGLHHSRQRLQSDFHVLALSKELVVRKFELTDVLAKIMNIQEGYLYHYHYMHRIYERYIQKIASLGEMNLDKVMQTLRSIALWYGDKEMYKEFTKIPICFTRNILANYMGISRTTLGTVLTALQREKLVFINERQQLFVK
ncbi:Crp/Fnr family transcriptional regulator [Listeria grandensis]|uniref:Crp/Fnr family transcriptional regulator n=1 Tax=Listeria grandensis TaxID=1494963 RepID=UPI00164CFA8D|nr:Crp/Fnr family transcriptional regulator [Listeria grandensis]MBC6315256.1 Crp/Fnr family transcriptional regulator [Listeria grandensis]